MDIAELRGPESLCFGTKAAKNIYFLLEKLRFICLGCGDRAFESHYSDQCGFDRRKAAGIISLRLSYHKGQVVNITETGGLNIKAGKAFELFVKNTVPEDYSWER